MFQRLLTVRGTDDVVALLSQQAGEQLPVRLIVVGHKNDAVMALLRRHVVSSRMSRSLEDCEPELLSRDYGQRPRTIHLNVPKIGLLEAGFTKHCRKPVNKASQVHSPEGKKLGLRSFAFQLPSLRN